MPDRMKPSRLLQRLEAEIASARSPLEADCKRAERAAYLARVGRVDEARAHIANLHQRYAESPQIDVTIWTNFVEGLIAYFDNVGTSTNDRVQRAYALSVAAGRDRMRALCAAWLAQWDYSRLDMPALARHVLEALTVAGKDHHTARSRACLVVAQALHLAGRPDMAQPWYGQARYHASIDGDDATTSALMHNMAWLRMLTIRQMVLAEGNEDRTAAEHALTNAESTEAFDQIKGDASWQELKPILRAQILSLQGNAREAVALYEQHLVAAGAPTRLQANLLADKAWCHIAQGDAQEAIACTKLAVGSLTDDTQIDDRAAAHSRLVQSFERLGDLENRNLHRELAARAWGVHTRMQAEILRLLAGLVSY